jgi:hypothetical protein
MNRIIAFILIIVVPAIFSAAVYSDHKKLTGGEDINAQWVWLFVGLIISYFGTVLSIQAVLGIRSISNRYFFKSRSPEIQKHFLNIHRKMKDFGEQDSDKILQQDFMSEIPTLSRVAMRMNNQEVKKVAKSTYKLHRALSKEALKPEIPAQAGQVNGYWALHVKVGELYQEIKNQIADMKAI